jgi:hypothetical protein
MAVEQDFAAVAHPDLKAWRPVIMRRAACPPLQPPDTSLAELAQGQ